MWLAIEPAGRADDPLGPWVPTVRIVLEESPALGYCAPTSGPDRPPAQVVVSAWSIGSPGDARPLALRKIPVPDDGGSTEGLFAPVGLAQGATAGWPPGRYVFRVGDPSGGYQRWFGVEVRQWAAGMDDGRTSPPETSPAP